MNSSKDDDDHPLPDGAFYIRFSPETQSNLECVIGKDLHGLETSKFVSINLIKKDLTDKGNQSDFINIRDQVMKSRVSEALVIYDPERQRQEEDLIVCVAEGAIFNLQQLQEDSILRLVDKSDAAVYQPPDPKEWYSHQSERDIEGSWVDETRPKIRLQVRRSVARRNFQAKFVDLGMFDTKDGYVSCEPFNTTFLDNLKHVSIMERGIQAVPTVTEGASQTELKHPKNIAIQYEARIFSEEEVAELWKSDKMRQFLDRAEQIVEDVRDQPDIMGSIRPDVEAFYRRDEVIVIEETKLVQREFFSDLVFTRNQRVTCVRWHPNIPGIVAMSVVENVPYETYLESLSKRLAMPNVVTIWSLRYPFFPQLLLRICDDVTGFEWHPFEDGTLVGGCKNGQLIIWDISEYVPKLKSGECTWDHKTFLASQMKKLHIEDGYIPILHWSAESDKDFSHLGAVEMIQWLPKSVWFSYDSAFPKANQNEDEVQLISCDGDKYVMIWSLRKAPTDDGVDSEFGDDIGPSKKSVGWSKLKLQSALPASVTSTGKYSPATGKYSQLNKVWKPVHKICFLAPGAKQDDDLFQVLITSLCVIDRPDLILARKDSSVLGRGEVTEEESDEDAKELSVEHSESERSADHSDDPDNEGPFADKTRKKRAQEEQDPSQLALPTFLMAGTIFGYVFRVDLTNKVRVDVETNDLIARVDWVTPLHDGPVKVMSRSPFASHLLLTMGGYSWAIWIEGKLTTPVIFHYVEGDIFTDAAWSLTQPDVVYFSDDCGNLQIWNIKDRKSEPFQTQNISGKTITALRAYAHEAEEGDFIHYLSVADETGTLHLFELPKHLRETTVERLDLLLLFMEDQMAKKMERKAIREQTEDQKQEQTTKQDDEEEFEKDRYVVWEENEYLKSYFQKERQVLVNIFGEDWKEFVKYPDLPRKKYYVELERRDSSEERKRQRELLRAKKKKGGSIFRKY